MAIQKTDYKSSKIESLGDYIHRLNQEHAEKLGIPLRTKSKETQGATHRIEIQFVSGPMAQKMREFYLKRKQEQKSGQNRPP